MTSLLFGDRRVGEGHRCYVIAELGPNWCVSADRGRNIAELRALIHAAHQCGADAVKLQLKSLSGYYASESLDRPLDARSPFATRREYVMAREPDDEVLALVNAECTRLGLHWSASPWDEDAVYRLGAWSPPWWKVASASLTDHVLLSAIYSAAASPLLLSTGMSTIAEIDDAAPALRLDFALLHCLSTYPAPEDECNLRAMATLRERFNCVVGWSGHERGLAVSIAAVAMGASIIERHLTMDRTHWGPDHASSLEPKGFAQLVRDVRVVERAMGDGAKVPMPSEAAARARLRRVT